jgi:antitoxin VapB
VTSQVQKIYTYGIYHLTGGNIMHTAKLFQNGRSQAVRLPKEFRIKGKEVKISKQGNKIILEPIEASWDEWFAAINQFSDDFMPNGREQPETQERDWSGFE